MKEANLITPRRLAGFMELHPSKQVVLNEMKEKIANIYQKFGFLPLDTPVLELSDVLLAKSGGDIDKEVYAFTKGDTNVCMRFDLTVPLARFVAMNENTLSFPFKRYQIEKVFRGEKPQKGRFRELIQCDADIIGYQSLPLVCDGECVKLVDEIFKTFNLKIVCHISNRNVLFGYCQELGLEDKTIDILTVLDKLGKIGQEKAGAMLSELGLNKSQSEKLLALTSNCGNFNKVLEKIENLATNETYQKGIADLKELYSYLRAYDINEENYVLDIGIIRGHNYYTGTVFEVYMPQHPEFGAVAAGGRYDNLAQYYTSTKLPGVGISIGLTRLFDLLDKNELLPTFKPTLTTLQILPLGDTLKECLTLQNYFQAKINCDVSYDERSFKAKLKEAGKKEIPYVLIVGENEVASGLLSLKNMQTGEQFNLTKEECLNKILK